MWGLLVRVLAILALLWLVRLLWRAIVGEGFSAQGSRQFRTRPGGSSPPGPGVITGEMKKDPQCGTYVSTELSIKSRHRGAELHFCSRECEQAFLQAHSDKSP